MVGAMSGKGDARREDAAARRLIEQNRGTIERLADQISGGAYSARRRPVPEPQPSGLIVHALGGGRPASEAPSPYVRVSPNERVVLADRETGRQLHLLGQIRRAGGQRRFALATKANGFVAELEAELGAKLADLDGRALDAGYDEDRLAADVRERLGVA